jgi:hypothetical protein
MFDPNTNYKTKHVPPHPRRLLKISALTSKKKERVTTSPISFKSFQKFGTKLLNAYHKYKDEEIIESPSCIIPNSILCIHIE